MKALGTLLKNGPDIFSLHPEALEWSGQIRNTALAFTTAAGGSGAGQSVSSAATPNGRAVFITEGTVGCSWAAELNILYNSANALNSTVRASKTIWAPQKGTASFSPNMFLKMDATITGYVRQAIDPATGINANGTISVVFNFNGYSFTHDFNYSADGVVAWIGDSIDGGTGATRTKDMYAFKTIDYLKQTYGLNYRLINFSESGWASDDHEEARMLGRYATLKPFRPKLIVYAPMVNDAQQSITADTWEANCEAMILQRDKLYPGTPFLILGATSLNNNTHETNAAALRARAATLANADNKIYYLPRDVQYGTATPIFDRTVLGNYLSNDGVHPTNTNTGLIYTQAIKPWIDANYTIL